MDANVALPSAAPALPPPGYLPEDVVVARYLSAHPPASELEAARIARTALSSLGWARPADPVKGRRPGRPDLSPREAEILRLLAEGRSNKEVARTLGLSVRTIETHRLNLRSKAGAGPSRSVLFALARSRGLV